MVRSPQERCGARVSGGDRPAYDAVIFDMDGVVTDTASLHAKAWRVVFDDTLAQFPETETRPFDPDVDYRRYVDGRPREDGVRSFLLSRGITLPEESSDGGTTVASVSEQKQAAFDALLDREGVAAFPDAVALLERLLVGAVPVALVTSSRNAERILDAAGLDSYFSVRVDGITAIEAGLLGKPDPAMFLEAARLLGASPQRTVVLEDAEAGVKAAVRGGFGLVVGVARTGHGDQLRAAGADVVVRTLDGFDPMWAPRRRPHESEHRDQGNDQWVLRYDSFDAATEGQRETLCTVGNGYWATRGASPEATADEVHYPGTYLAGIYNRVRTPLADGVVEDEHLVNAPNWLPLSFRIDGADWFHPSNTEVVDFSQELDLKVGILTRVLRIRDTGGRSTLVTSRRFISQADHHVACLKTTFVSENWSGTVTVRSAINGAVANRNVDEYTLLADTHLVPVAVSAIDDETTLLECVTSQSRVHIAMAARTRVFAAHDLVSSTRDLMAQQGYVAQEFDLEVHQGRPVTVEKVAVVSSSRDRAIASPSYAVTSWIRRLPDISVLEEAHERAWRGLWRDFAVEIDGPARQSLALNLNTFHVLQTVAAANADLDAGVPARGLHGEGYRGHVFWDEIFVYPMLTMRRPDLSRALLGYRYRRLPEAKAAAREAGHDGAMFPWQSGVDGREETPVQLYNKRSERWIPDNSRYQRHVGLAVAYGVWEYFETTADEAYLLDQGIELLVEVSRFFASLARFDGDSDRYDIDGVMGPDEFHDANPGADRPGLRNNAYTNVMTAWVLKRTIDGLGRVRGRASHSVWERIHVTPDELENWAHISRRLRVPFHKDGVISQFEGYEQLPEFDWAGYRAKYGRIGRMDLILHSEGDSTNNYRLSKQADVLMLLYLFSAEELRELLADMGYGLSPETVLSTVEFYGARSTHGSTLSNVVHSWVEARRDRSRSWEFLTQALDSDLADIQGGTTREGIHLGALAGSVDLVVRCYTGLEFRGDALWFNPVLPPELPRVHFTLVYRDQPIRVEVTAEHLRLALEPCEAAPITVRTPQDIVVLAAGDTHEFRLLP
ncbi:HAD superfamily hydrolase (TIGR01509 family)/beta-phosphoglucomutase family hydrolase [Rhodoglobus vestalii]|uniref:HAD superfamily hydrolase (TIGR01509 family)/beta-phosphoglucomutase family hydrolase n=1 Tax=Rhodoglobus vestalii TaxID=193384 RepID=A0A8H2K8Q0_9MICO|nr:beta-phosphoglucomutase family hydrolase [Rhodoglobus vestalii]TQO20719.1 HAD superfamily hydrolase (TIGR01509 family)/beta-phosphoglucomutase family hydrolase [Rhodoglobus vestalii]